MAGGRGGDIITLQQIFRKFAKFPNFAGGGGRVGGWREEGGREGGRGGGQTNLKLAPRRGKVQIGGGTIMESNL